MKQMKLLKIKGLLITGLLITVSLTGCKTDKTDLTDINEVIETNTNIDSEDSESDVSYAPYVLVDYGEAYIDPYPMREIQFTTGNKLYIEEQSSQGMDDLELFIINLKTAIAQRDAEKFLSLISDDIEYTYSIGKGKLDFTNEYDLNYNPENSWLWEKLDKILIYGGYLSFADVYQIPYMYHEFSDSTDYDAFVIGDGINLRSDPSVIGNIVEQMNFDQLKILEYSMETYNIDGIDYNWVKVELMNGKEGYMVDKYIFRDSDYRITINHANGYWEIVEIIEGI